MVAKSFYTGKELISMVLGTLMKLNLFKRMEGISPYSWVTKPGEGN